MPGGASSRRLGGKNAEFKYRRGGRDDLRMAAASGVLNVLLYGEERTKAESVVRGGHRSFLTGSHLGGPLNITDSPGTRRGKVRVGGTLRRSWHAVVFVNGRPIPGSRVIDENSVQTPRDYPLNSPTGIVGVIGSNSGYGGWVDGGTYRMPARPMLSFGVRAMTSNLRTLFAAGWQRFTRGRP